jgi:hypothetical protein
MANEFVHNNPRDTVKERFTRLEEKVTNISHNVSLLMVTLASKLKSFIYFHLFKFYFFFFNFISFTLIFNVFSLDL